jgi:hypothetical protein
MTVRTLIDAKHQGLHALIESENNDQHVSNAKTMEKAKKLIESGLHCRQGGR